MQRNADVVLTEVLLIVFLTQIQTENSTFPIVTKRYFKRNCLCRYSVGRDSEWVIMGLDESHLVTANGHYHFLGSRGQEKKKKTRVAVNSKGCHMGRRFLLWIWLWVELSISVHLRCKSKISWHLSLPPSHLLLAPIKKAFAVQTMSQSSGQGKAETNTGSQKENNPVWPVFKDRAKNKWSVLSLFCLSFPWNCLECVITS